LGEWPHHDNTYIIIIIAIAEIKLHFADIPLDINYKTCIITPIFSNRVMHSMTKVMTHAESINEVDALILKVIDILEETDLTITDKLFDTSDLSEITSGLWLSLDHIRLKVHNGAMDAMDKMGEDMQNAWTPYCGEHPTLTKDKWFNLVEAHGLECGYNEWVISMIDQGLEDGL